MENLLCVSIISEIALSLLELGFAFMSDSAAVLSVKLLLGLDIFVVLVFLKTLSLLGTDTLKK